MFSLLVLARVVLARFLATKLNRAETSESVNDESAPLLPVDVSPRTSHSRGSFWGCIVIALIYLAMTMLGESLTIESKYMYCS